MLPPQQNCFYYAHLNIITMISQTLNSVLSDSQVNWYWAEVQLSKVTFSLSTLNLGIDMIRDKNIKKDYGEFIISNIKKVKVTLTLMKMFTMQDHFLVTKDCVTVSDVFQCIASLHILLWSILVPLKLFSSVALQLQDLHHVQNCSISHCVHHKCGQAWIELLLVTWCSFITHKK